MRTRHVERGLRRCSGVPVLAGLRRTVELPLDRRHLNDVAIREARLSHRAAGAAR